MSTEFEKFVRKNRNDFDDAAPSGKVWKEIEKTIPVKKEAKRFTLIDIYKWSAAAAIFFIVLTSVYFLVIKKDSHENLTTEKETEQDLPGLNNLVSISTEYAAEFKEASEAVENRQKELRSA